MCDEPSLEVMKNYLSWGCEVLRNLSFVEDLTMLDDINLGQHGQEVYKKLGHVAREQKSTW